LSAFSGLTFFCFAPMNAQISSHCTRFVVMFRIVSS